MSIIGSDENTETNKIVEPCIIVQEMKLKKWQNFAIFSSCIDLHKNLGLGSSDLLLNETERQCQHKFTG